MSPVSNPMSGRPNPGRKLRVALEQGILSHYRSALFAAFDRSERIEVTFFTDGADRDGIAHLPGDAVLRQRQARVHPIGRLFWQRRIAGLALTRKFDVLVLMGDPHYLSNWVAAAIARLAGVPVLFWTHGWRAPERGLKRFVRLAFYRLANGLLLYSERGRALGIAAGYPAARMAVIYNSLDLDRADLLVERIEAEGAAGDPFPAMAGEPRRPVLICTARLTPNCEFELLLEAARLLGAAGTPVRVVLVGDGPMRMPLEAQARAAGIDAHFTGAVYDEERLGRWLYHADLTVSPGKVGLTAIHSMMYGTPVLTHGDLDRQMPEVETVIEGETGAFFARGDAGDLARAIGDWLAAPRDRTAIRRSCRAMVHGKWNPRNQATHFENAICDVARGG